MASNKCHIFRVTIVRKFGQAPKVGGEGAASGILVKKSGVVFGKLW